MADWTILVYNKITNLVRRSTMMWQATWENPFRAFLCSFQSLIGDKRTGQTLAEIIRGMISAGSLRCLRIAMQSPILSKARNVAQRVIRLVKGQSTKRSQLDDVHLTAKLRERAIAHLVESNTNELWVILDGSPLCKPYARDMPALMKVRDPQGKLVPGYSTLTALGITPTRRGILYHRVYSSQEEGFVSEPAEVQKALQTVSQALQPLKERIAVTWILDRGFDDIAVWRTIWEQGEHLVCRIDEEGRLVEFQDRQGQWQRGSLAQARRHLRLRGRAQTEMEVCLGRQKRPKRQRVKAMIWAVPVRLRYDRNVRRPGGEDWVQKEIWLVEIRLPETNLEPWLLVSSWPVTNASQALRVFCMYRQRWAVEDSFKFTKECLGWEEVQLLDWQGIRTLIALAWVAAAFLYEMGVTLDWPEVELLARLGGWEGRKDRPPGKIVLSRGLRRLLEAQATLAFLDRYIAEHGPLPPRIIALAGLSPIKEL
jgi:hypothetical protein